MAKRFFDREVAWTSAAVFLGTTHLALQHFRPLDHALDTFRPPGACWFWKISPRRITAVRPSCCCWRWRSSRLIGISCLTRYSLGYHFADAFFPDFISARAATDRALCRDLWLLHRRRRPGLRASSDQPYALSMAGYAIFEGTDLFPQHWLQRSLNPDFSLPLPRCLEQIYHQRPNLPAGRSAQARRQLGKRLFSRGVAGPLQEPFPARRLRYFVLLCLPMLLIRQAGR